MVPVLTAIAGLVLGFLGGFLYRKSVVATHAQSIEARAQKLMLDAEREADMASKRALAEAKDKRLRTPPSIQITCPVKNPAASEAR